MTPEQLLERLEQTYAKINVGLGSAGISTQDEYKTILKDVDQILRTALRKSQSGLIYLGEPSKRLMYELEHGNHSIAERVTKMRELRDHLTTTNLLCTDRKYRWL